jgi:hypothetical protein
MAMPHVCPTLTARMDRHQALVLEKGLWCTAASILH